MLHTEHAQVGNREGCTREFVDGESAMRCFANQAMGEACDFEQCAPLALFDYRHYQPILDNHCDANVDTGVDGNAAVGIATVDPWMAPERQCGGLHRNVVVEDTFLVEQLDGLERTLASNCLLNVNFDCHIKVWDLALEVDIRNAMLLRILESSWWVPGTPSAGLTSRRMRNS